MSVETRAFIKATEKQIYKYMSSLCYNTSFKDMTEIVGGPGMYYVMFDFIDEDRKLVIHKMDTGGVFVDEAEKEYEKKYGKQDGSESEEYMLHSYGVADNTKGVLVSLTSYGDSYMIMRLLCIEFGGWHCEVDYDPKYKKVRKSKNKKPIFDYVFGGK